MLMVDPTIQGSGVGAQLVDWAIRYVFATGRPLVRLDCPETADGLRRFYENLGFKQVDTNGAMALFELGRA
jgi:GNAT superfamily N-acetyltransferase